MLQWIGELSIMNQNLFALSRSLFFKFTTSCMNHLNIVESIDLFDASIPSTRFRDKATAKLMTQGSGSTDMTAE